MTDTTLSANEDAFEKAHVLFQHNPNYRKVFLAILGECSSSPIKLEDLERLIQNLPSYEKLKQPPYFPISWLCDVACLEESYVDHEGALHSGESLLELDEDEFDDLVATFAYQTTPLGSDIRAHFNPTKRLTSLIESESDRQAVYEDLLHYLTEKRTFAQIAAFLDGREELITTSKDGVALQPSLFIDKLDAIGAIAFDAGWQITPEGKEYLSA